MLQLLLRMLLLQTLQPSLRQGSHSAREFERGRRMAAKAPDERKSGSRCWGCMFQFGRAGTSRRERGVWGWMATAAGQFGGHAGRGGQRSEGAFDGGSHLAMGPGAARDRRGRLDVARCKLVRRTSDVLVPPSREARHASVVARCAWAASRTMWNARSTARMVSRAWRGTHDALRVMRCACQVRRGARSVARRVHGETRAKTAQPQVQQINQNLNQLAYLWYISCFLALNEMGEALKCVYLHGSTTRSSEQVNGVKEGGK